MLKTVVLVTAAGYPPVEPVKVQDNDKANGSGDGKSKGAKLAESMQEVLKSPAVWILAITYFFVYLVRQGSTSWLVFYLLEQKGAKDAAAAAITVSGMTNACCLMRGSGGKA